MQTVEVSSTVAARVAREKAAHEDPHIDDALRKWWSVFPHVFTNPSMLSLHAFYAAELGNVRDKSVLEYGCGQGEFALWLLDQGATVSGIDVSEFNIEHCREKARAHGIDASRYKFEVMDAHQTSFPDASFDRIVGNGIIHHLDLAAAMNEVDRLLKPGEKALFQEPLGENPLLRVYRKFAGIHTDDERPLTRADLQYLIENWNVKTKYTGVVTLPFCLLTSLIARPYPSNWLLRAATRVEDQLNNQHVIDHWNRFAVLVYTSGGSPSSPQGGFKN
jgi:SAM-dependent methyltransferase